MVGGDTIEFSSTSWLRYYIQGKHHQVSTRHPKICATLAAGDGVGGFEKVHTLHHKSVCFYEEWKRNTE